MTTAQLLLTVAQCAMTIYHENPQYSRLYRRLIGIVREHDIPKSFSAAMNYAREKHAPVKQSFLDTVASLAPLIDAVICHGRDDEYIYFDAEELEQYALRDNNDVIVERTQHTFMRCAVAIHGANIERITTTYNMISTHRFIPPLALLRTAGTSRETICSEATVSSPLSTVTEVRDLAVTLARIYARCQNACVSLQHLDCKLFRTRRAVNVVGIANVIDYISAPVRSGFPPSPCYMTLAVDVWQDSARDLLDHLVKQTEENCLRVIINIPDIFMTRLGVNGNWSTFSPSHATILRNCSSQEFAGCYAVLESDTDVPRVETTALHIWSIIVILQNQLDHVSIVYRDNVSKMNGPVPAATNPTLGALQPFSEGIALFDNISILLPSFVDGNEFKFEELYSATKYAVELLDELINIDDTVSENTHCSISVQGLADVLIKLGLAFDDPEASQLSIDISATVYHSGMTTNASLAVSKGRLPMPYDSLTPLGIIPCLLAGTPVCTLYHWESLSEQLQVSGVRRPLLIAYTPMPPSSFHRHLADCCYPYQTYVGTRQTVAGPIKVISELLIDALKNAKLLTPQLVKDIQSSNGSIHDIDGISDQIKRLFRTADQIDTARLLSMTLQRKPFVCQAEPFVLFTSPQPTFNDTHATNAEFWAEGGKAITRVSIRR